MDERCARFYRHADATLAAAGYDVTDSKCPALVAESAQTAAENAFLTLISEALGLPDFTKTTLEIRAKVLELHMQTIVF